MAKFKQKDIDVAVQQKNNEESFKEWEVRSKQCKAEIDAILKKYDCTIASFFEYTPNGVAASPELVNIKDKVNDGKLVRSSQKL